MDSIAVAYWQRPELAFTVDYGQRAAEAEVSAASQVADELGIQHEVISIDCSQIGSGDMAGSDAIDIAPVPEWWPFRNQLLITFSAARGVTLGVSEIMTGSVASDSSHADGRLGFYQAMDTVTSYQEGGIRVSAPALRMTTVELVQLSSVPREILAWAHSCHTGNIACGQCRGCIKHYEVTKEVYGIAY
ncbi:7-cyano-7-deazaguanine synthase [Ruegeria halocynthiae]|uniref:7-cyano-7-deazaguanine synthase n=1 Tax=Ruegeria halocynthiae TaxID=985054 RepID=UPI0009DD057B|nr:7-cyano-7-deazaguanine synthase [Ruegeria halocynthiae]